MKKITKAIWKINGCQKGIPDAQTIAKVIGMIIWRIEDYKKVRELLYDDEFGCFPIVFENEKIIILKTAVSNRIIQISKIKPEVRFYAPNGSFCLFNQLNSILSGLILNGELIKVKYGNDEITEDEIKQLFLPSGKYLTNYEAQTSARRILFNWFKGAKEKKTELEIKALDYIWKIIKYQIIYENKTLLKLFATEYALYQNGKFIKKYKDKRIFLINNLTKELIYSMGIK